MAAFLAAPALAANQALVSGAYGATLGAGGATAAEPSGFGQNPAGLRPERWGARLDFHRPYGMDELEVADAGAFLDRTHWGVAAEWRQTGVADLYSEQGFQLTPTLRLGKAGTGFPGVLDLGLACQAWRSQWPDGAAVWDWRHGMGAGWRPLSRLKAGAFVLGLPLDLRADEEPSDADAATAAAGSDRILQWGLEADSGDPEGGPDGPGPGRAGAGQILRLDFRKTGAAAWRTLASLSLRPYPGLEFTGGLAGPPFQAALGLRLSWAGWECRQALRYHRYLGRTWLSGVGYSHRIGLSPPN